MTLSISAFFRQLGVPLTNAAWSWGAQAGHLMLLRGWAEEYDLSTKEVVLLKEPSLLLAPASNGLRERMRHLRALWQGDIAGYAVIMKQVATDRLRVGEFREDAVFIIDSVRQDESGKVLAHLSGLVEVQDLPTHCATHRTQAQGQLVLNEVAAVGPEGEDFAARVDRARELLIGICRQRTVVTYETVMNECGFNFRSINTALTNIGKECRDAGQPILTSVVVSKADGRCSKGLQSEFGVDDEDDERRRCYEFWAMPPESSEAATDPQQGDLEARAAVFAQVQVRPEQRDFREAVFWRCQGRCVVSGCTVPQALEAAHLQGRDWRQGHNGAEDGILLRRDLHALYDAGLMQFVDGRITLDGRAGNHYSDYQGRQVQGLPAPQSASPAAESVPTEAFT